MQFEARKAVAAIGYLVQATNADLYSVMKMIYLADKEHLGRYGRTVTGDDFTAMEKGPLPEATYNLCKFVQGKRAHFDALPEARSVMSMNGHNFVFHEAPDFDLLSRTNRNALDHAIDIYQRGGWRAVFAASHDAAWSAAWAEAKARDRGSIGMDVLTIAATMSNAPALIEYLSDPHPGEAASIR